MLTINNELLESFYEINKAVYRLFKKEADRFGVTEVQLKALYKISLNPSMGLGELAKKLRLTNSTVSGVIDRLVQSGLVERIVPPENRRSVSIQLTSEGEELLSKVISDDSIFIRKIDKAMDLPEDDLNNLLRMHKLILEKLALEEE